VLVRLGSNLRDCPPFKSEHRAGLTPEPETDWQTAFDLATAAEKSDLARAVQLYLEAAAIDGEHALLNYRIARALDRLDRKTEALAYFEKAKNEDICPLRIISPVALALTRIAAETKVPLVDAAGLLAAKSPDGIPGYDWYVDHVHPTIGGHQLIARALAAQLRDSGLLASSAAWPEDKRREAYARHLQNLGSAYFADGARRVGWLERWARRQRLAEENIPNDAPGHARLGFRRLDLGDEAGAQESFSEALRLDRGVTKLLEERAQQLEAEGRPERAAMLRRELRNPTN
jgi:tetratricopeptide (TPR) repeat protein